MEAIQPYIRTRSGAKFWFLEPKSEDILVSDIAHALSKICRFCGHTKRFYSVAEHSLLVARAAEMSGASGEVISACLIHDVSEAYIGDIATPLKKCLPGYAEIEARLQAVIFAKFGVELTDEFKEFDHGMLYHEGRALLGGLPEDWDMWEPRDDLVFPPIPPVEPDRDEIARDLESRLVDLFRKSESRER